MTKQSIHLAFMKISFLISAILFLALLQISDPKAAPKCRSVKIIVPYAVGTATDLIFRAFGQAINRQSTGSLIKVVNKTHSTVIEENMTGTPDGCQLLGITQSLVAKFLLEKSAPEWSSFTPVAMLTRSPLAIVSRANIKDANLTNLMEAASEKSNRLSVGETSSPLERAFRMQLEDVLGVSFKVTNFQNARQSLVALLTHKVDLGLVSLPAAKRRADLRQVKVLAVTDTLENMRLSDIATLQEQGVNTAFGVDRILLAPQETSVETVAKVSKRFEKALEDPELEERLSKLYTKSRFKNPDELTQYFENLSADWAVLRKKMIKMGRPEKSG